MRKLLFLLLLTPLAYADSYRYAGSDIHHAYHKYSANNRHLVGHVIDKPYTVSRTQQAPVFSAYHGYKISDDFAFEAGFSVLKSFDDRMKRRSGYLRTKGLHAQTVIFIPVYNMAELYVAGGVSIINAIYDDYVREIYFCTQKLAPRVSGGFQVPVSESINLRAGIVWHDLTGFQDHSFSIDNHIHVGLGFNYRFE